MNPALVSVGRSELLVRIALLQIPLLVGLVFLALPFGLKAIAFAFVLRAYIMLPHQLMLLKNAIGVEPMSVIKVVMPPVVASLALVAVVVVSEPLVRDIAPGRLAYVMMAGALGLSTYVAALALFARSFLASQLQALRPLLRGQSAAPASQIGDSLRLD
jgi:hypothetical protein